MPLTATQRSSLVGRVIDQLRTQIESGEWPLGRKIPTEPELVRSLGVGRNTVREAVRALVHNGMLEPKQGDGTYVRADDELGAALHRRLRRAGQLEALEVRATLETSAARLAALRRTPDDVRALRAALSARDAAWADRDDERLVAADLEFHRAALAAAHNGMLADLYAHLTDGLRSVLEAIVHSAPATLSDEARYQRESHAKLVDAIEAGDPEAARACVEEYLGEAEDSVRRLHGPTT
jgi:DNA-binding FadR family transcriptional regulator